MSPIFSMSYRLCQAAALAAAPVCLPLSVSAKEPLNEAQKVIHSFAVTMFEKGCMATAPEFEAAPDIFLKGGLASNGGGFWVDLENGIIANVGPASSGLGKSCSVNLINTSFDVTVEKLREIVAEQWDGRRFEELPPVSDDKTHLFNEISDASGAFVSVAVGGGSDGFVSMQYNVFIPQGQK